MFPIYRKNHIWSSISRSPDLRSLLQNSFPDWRLPLQWIMFRNSLSQWRDRTGIRPVSLLIRVCKIKNILLELIEAGSKPTNVIWFAFQAYIIFCVLSSFFFAGYCIFIKTMFHGDFPCARDLHWHVRRPQGGRPPVPLQPLGWVSDGNFVLWGGLWKILLVFQVGRFSYK